jgi:hypothetical protein
MGHPFRPVALLFHLIRLAVATLVAAVGLPLLLSTAVGARLLAGAAGRALGARVEVDRVCCVWWQPLRVEGMRVYMPTTRSSVVSSSGDDTSEGPPSQPQQEPDQQLGATAQPVGAAGADAAASSVPDQSPEQQQQQHSGFEVLSVERISTAGGGGGAILDTLPLLLHGRHTWKCTCVHVSTHATSSFWVGCTCA